MTTADYTVAVTNAVSIQGVLSDVARITVLPDSDQDGLPLTPILSFARGGRSILAAGACNNWPWS